MKESFFWTFGGERTAKGYPAIWEKGGGGMNSGDAQIVASPEGQPLYPIAIGRKSKGDHALFVVRPETIVVKAHHNRGKWSLFIYRIYAIDKEEEEGKPYYLWDKVEYSTLFYYQEGKWNKPLPKKFFAAVEAAKKKAMDYHCRKPYFLAPKGEEKEAME